jgi:LPS export ABC transporter protein LptC
MQLSRFSFFGLCLAACGLILACENDPEEVVAMTKPSRDIEEAKNIKAIYSQSGNLTAILEAPIMYRVKDDTIYTEFPESVKVTFYKDSSGIVESVIQGNYAKYYELLSKVYIKDSVVVINISGDTLYAQDLWWDQNQEIFYSLNPVRVRTLTQKLDGTGIQAKADFSNYNISNPRGVVALPTDIKFDKLQN